MSFAIQGGRQTGRAVQPGPMLLGGVALLWLIYSLVFVGTVGTPLGRAMAAATANVLPLAILAAGVRLVLMKWLWGRPLSVQAVGHGVLGTAFAAGWYAAAMLLLAVLGALRGGGFHLTGFVGPVLAWQIFQGLILYSAVAAVCYALARPAIPAEPAELNDASVTLQRYLVREGEEFRPMDVNDIISIVGAQDYSEVATARGRHLVRMSLGEFQSRLDPGRFIRVHRSTIIHLVHLERAEPAGGGRMLAHMADGQRIAISRRGVRALRPLIV